MMGNKSVFYFERVGSMHDLLNSVNVELYFVKGLVKWVTIWMEGQIRDKCNFRCIFIFYEKY